MFIFKKSVRITIGVILITVGIILGFVPFVPGVVLVVFGLQIAGLGFLFPEKFRKAGRRIRDKIKELFINRNS